MKKFVLGASALTFLATSVATAAPLPTRPVADTSAVQNVQYDRGGREFRRGERLPRNLRGAEFIYDDWRRSDLPRPPQGFRWMMIGDQYILASVANGTIPLAPW